MAEETKDQKKKRSTTKVAIIVGGLILALGITAFVILKYKSKK
ncbi:MAG: hypothetical protein WCI04_00010 [archaeon]